MNICRVEHFAEPSVGCPEILFEDGPVSRNKASALRNPMSFCDGDSVFCRCQTICV